MSRFLALTRLAWRDLRGGLRHYVIFIACLVLGVGALTAISASSQALRDGLADQGAALLGGDVAFSRSFGAPFAAEAEFLRAHGKISLIYNLRAMARGGSGGRPALIELKAVDGLYPLRGALSTTPEAPLEKNLAEQDGRFGLIADHALANRLGVGLGDEIQIGAARFRLTAWLDHEPDSLGAIGFGPRALTSIPAVEASGLLKPGALARLSLRVALDDARPAALAALKQDFTAQFPESGFELRDRTDPSPQLSRNIERFSQFLSLIGLTGLACGGIGVAAAAAGLIERKQKSFAILKALGATGGEAVALVLIEVMIVAFVASLLGAAWGLAAPFALARALRDALPFALSPGLDFWAAVQAVAFGLLTTLAFSLAPLDQARAVPVATLLRDAGLHQGRWSRRGFFRAATAGLALVGFAVAISPDRNLTLAFALATLGALGLLYGAAQAAMFLARRAPRVRFLSLRLALGNMGRPGALTPAFMLSLGLGVTLLAALTATEGALRAEIGAGVPKTAPSFFFLDVPARDAGAFSDFLHQNAPEGIVAVAPMLRGRIVSVKNLPVEQIQASDRGRWALDGDRGITFAAKLPDGSRLVEGEWWAENYDGPPLVSMEQGVAEGLGLKIGDQIAVNVLGRRIAATVANLRKVDWRSFNINFVMVFSPKTFAGAPFPRLMTLASGPHDDAAREGALLAAAAQKFPDVAAVSLRETLETVNGLLDKLTVAIRAAAALVAIASLLVLGGAIAAGQRRRLYEAMVLKVLGATRGQLLGALALEFLLLGAAAGLFGLVAGQAAAQAIGRRLLDLQIGFDPGAAALTVIAAVGFALALGGLSAFRGLAQKPAQSLREA